MIKIRVENKTANSNHNVQTLYILGFFESLMFLSDCTRKNMCFKKFNFHNKTIVKEVKSSFYN